jgi:hypothetical protein
MTHFKGCRNGNVKKGNGKREKDLAWSHCGHVSVGGSGLLPELAEVPNRDSCMMTTLERATYVHSGMPAKQTTTQVQA